MKPTSTLLTVLTLATLMMPAMAEDAVPNIEPPSEAFQKIFSRGYLTQDATGDYNPKGLVTRAELASILVKAFKLQKRMPEKSAPLTIQDVPDTHWAYPAIRTAI